MENKLVITGARLPDNYREFLPEIHAKKNSEGYHVHLHRDVYNITINNPPAPSAAMPEKSVGHPVTFNVAPEPPEFNPKPFLSENGFLILFAICGLGMLISAMYIHKNQTWPEKSTEYVDNRGRVWYLRDTKDLR